MIPKHASASLKARWEKHGRELTDDVMPARMLPGAVTVDGLCDEYLAHLRERYDAGWQRNNLAKVDLSLRPVRELYGPESAAEFKPKKLQAVRFRMLETGKLCRSEVNDRVRTVRAAFTWAVAEELVPGDLGHALSAVKALGKGEYGAREGRTVGPVERTVVDATLPFLCRPVAALVELMWWTGARPSELFGLRPCDIDRSDNATWVVKLVHPGKYAWRWSRTARPRASNSSQLIRGKIAAQGCARSRVADADAMREHRHSRATG